MADRIHVANSKLGSETATIKVTSKLFRSITCRLTLNSRPRTAHAPTHAPCMRPPPVPVIFGEILATLTQHHSAAQASHWRGR